HSIEKGALEVGVCRGSCSIDGTKAMFPGMSLRFQNDTTSSTRADRKMIVFSLKLLRLRDSRAPDSSAHRAGEPCIAAQTINSTGKLSAAHTRRFGCS